MDKNTTSKYFFNLILLISLFSHCSLRSQTNQFLIPFRQNNLWGYSDSNGKVLIPCQFEDAQFFTQDVAKVRLNGKWGLINPKGELFLPCQYDWLYCGSQKGRIIACKGGEKGGHGGKWGFVASLEGTEIPLQYDLIRETGITGKLGVCISQLWGVIDATGKRIIPIQYEIERISEHQFEKKTDNTSIPAFTKIIDIEDKNEYLKLKFQEGLARVKWQNKWGFINEYGNSIIPFLYDFLGEFNEELVVAIQKIEGKYQMGFLDRLGELKIPFEYEVEQEFYKQIHFSEGLAAVVKNGKKGYINPQNEIIIPFEFAQVFPFEEQRALVSYSAQQLQPEWKVMDTKGNLVCTIPSTYLVLDKQFHEGFIRIRVQGSEFWMDKNGGYVGKNNHYQKVERFVNGLAKVYQQKKDSTKVGYVNKRGENIIPIQYEALVPFDNQGEVLFKAKMASKWGVIRKNQQILIPFEFDDLHIFLPITPQKNWIAAQKNGKWGFINFQAKEMIPLEYEQVTPFLGAFSLVLYQGKWGYINKANKRFWKD